MIKHAIILLAVAILAIAGWAYHVNYNTMTALDEVARLRSAIAKEREALQVLRVEWAYLNQPDRLQALVERYNAELQLVPMTPEVLQHAAAVPFPGRGDEPAVVIAGGEPSAPAVPMPRVRPANWNTQ